MKPWDFVKNILESKEKLEDLSEYGGQRYVICNMLSCYPDMVMYAHDAARMTSTSDQMHYDYLWHSARKYRRKYVDRGKRPGKDEELQAISRFYSLNMRKAAEARRALSDEQIRTIIELMNIKNEKSNS